VPSQKRKATTKKLWLRTTEAHALQLRIFWSSSKPLAEDMAPRLPLFEGLLLEERDHTFNDLF
jgi:hypothetical protein